MWAKDLSVIIPARNEIFLGKTIESVLAAAEMDTEVIAVLDGYWPDPPLADNPRVKLLHCTVPVGQRGGTNVGAQISRAKYVMKLDAHCHVDQGFDRKLMAECDYDWTVIPRMFNLHAFDHVCRKCEARYYQADPVPVCKCGGTEFDMGMVWKPRQDRLTDFACFDRTLHFQYWRHYHRRPEAAGEIADVMSSVGACFFMHRLRFLELEGMDEGHGSWGQFGTEVSCKTWLSGGRQVVNKRTWFSHLFRVGKLCFPYEISGNAQERAREYSRDMWFNNRWHKQVRKLRWIVEKFWPVKDWSESDLEALAR